MMSKSTQSAIRALTNKVRLILRALVPFVAALAALPIAAQGIRVGPFLQDATPQSIWIVWETDEAGTTYVDFGQAGGPLNRRSTPAESIGTVNGAVIYQAQLTGLAPETEYIYRVSTATNSSSVLAFETPAERETEQPFRFVAYSDTQGGPISDKHTEVINEGVIGFVQDNFGEHVHRHLDFSIQPGDLVSTGSNYNQWKDQYFDEQQNLIQHIPVYPVPGNHEQDAHWFFDYFVLPENGTPGFLEHWWYKDHGNVRIIGIDTNGAYRIQAQLDWLDTVLDSAASDPHIDFVFAQFHHPHLSGIWTPGNTDYSGVIVEKLGQFSTETGKPSVHFFGHTHAYERGQSRDHTHSYINVAAGEGGIDYWGITPPVDYPEYQRVFPDWGFVLVEVTAGDDPQFRVRRVSRGNEVEPLDNEVLDDFTIRRYNNAPSTPGPISPAHGEDGLDPDGFTLQASDYDDPDGDFHLESHFEISVMVQGEFQVVDDRWIRFENWYSPEDPRVRENGYYSVNTVEDPDITKVELGPIDAETTHYWRVRYRDETLGWSEWSQRAAFTTGPAVTGACCTPDGLCTDVRQFECADPSFWLEGVLCETAPCPQVIRVYDEDFDDIQLGPNQDEGLNNPNAFTHTPPDGWNIDNDNMPEGGVTEWRGWSFTDPAWWAAMAGDQGRSGFTKADGVIAVADPDEWHDAATAGGNFDSTLVTPPIDITQLRAGTATLAFDSAWMPEGRQRAILTASFDGGPEVIILEFASQGGDPDFRAGNVNDTVIVDLNNPDDAQHVVLRFTLKDAGNNWFWAIDNLSVFGEPREKTVILLREDFEQVALGPPVDEPSIGETQVWSGAPPTGWIFDDSAVPSIEFFDRGTTEWEGWAITDKDWWNAVAEGQLRSEFTSATGAIAVADPDEWDDRGSAQSLGDYDAKFISPPITLAGIRPGTVTVAFHSSWRPEDTQKAELTLAIDRLPPIQILDWRSDSASPAYKPDATNERIEEPIAHTLNASSARLTWRVYDARNDWWWAIDDIVVRGACFLDPNCDRSSDFMDLLIHLARLHFGNALADIDADGIPGLGDLEYFLVALPVGCP